MDPIVCGGFHTITISNTNDIYVWGNNTYGHLSRGDNMYRNLPWQLNFKF